MFSGNAHSVRMNTSKMTAMEVESTVLWNHQMIELKEEKSLMKTSERSASIINYTVTQRRDSFGGHT